MSKNHLKVYTKPPNSGYGYKHRDLGDLALLKMWLRYWQEGRQLSDVKTAFMSTPALNNFNPFIYGILNPFCSSFHC